MKFTSRTYTIDAVYLDSIKTGLDFLAPDELVVLSQNAIYVKTPHGVIKAGVGDDWLIHVNDSLQVLTCKEFEICYGGLDFDSYLRPTRTTEV